MSHHEPAFGGRLCDASRTNLHQVFQQIRHTACVRGSRHGRFHWHDDRAHARATDRLSAIVLAIVSGVFVDLLCMFANVSGVFANVSGVYATVSAVFAIVSGVLATVLYVFALVLYLVLCGSALTDQVTLDG